ncbi:hypothetical protein WR25_00336 isoform B [Diploscapter pachys]|uniref:Uncharacterized protein n=1 Tax=Diploscapter pachys TaxID=2018661 RepID=A0A2A2L6M1_9BILA|nr:hypothetical protein WR25_00336 isoform A [Diploscapter pachys]PAV81813.1 hypothetical protein WR25_00336 isoform B [Diploscapter pachys]
MIQDDHEKSIAINQVNFNTGNRIVQPVRHECSHPHMDRSMSGGGMGRNGRGWLGEERAAAAARHRVKEEDARFASSFRMQHSFAFGAIFLIALISISNALPKPGSITIPLTAVRVPGKYMPSGKTCNDMFGAFPKEKYHQQADKFDLFIRHVNKAGNKTRDDKVTDDEVVKVIEFYRKKPLSADEKKQVADFIDKLAQVRSNYEYELLPTFGTKVSSSE